MSDEQEYAGCLGGIYGQMSEVELHFEELLHAVSEEINRVMVQGGVNKTELACRMEVSKPYVTRLLNGTANVSLLTLAKISVALGHRVGVTLVPAGWESRVFAVSPRNETLRLHRRAQYDGFTDKDEQVVVNAEGY